MKKKYLFISIVVIVSLGVIEAYHGVRSRRNCYGTVHYGRRPVWGGSWY